MFDSATKRATGSFRVIVTLLEVEVGTPDSPISTITNVTTLTQSLGESTALQQALTSSGATLTAVTPEVGMLIHFPRVLH